MAKAEPFYENALRKAKEDLVSALSEQEDLAERVDETKNRIANLRRVIAGLSDYCGVETENWVGPTEACTIVMEKALLPLDTKEVINALGEMGLEVSGKNPAATITSILNRLAERHAIRKVATPGGTRWIGPKVGKGPWDE